MVNTLEQYKLHHLSQAYTCHCLDSEHLELFQVALAALELNCFELILHGQLQEGLHLANLSLLGLLFVNISFTTSMIF